MTFGRGSGMYDVLCTLPLVDGRVELFRRESGEERTSATFQRATNAKAKSRIATNAPLPLTPGCFGPRSCAIARRASQGRRHHRPGLR